VPSVPHRSAGRLAYRSVMTRRTAALQRWLDRWGRLLPIFIAEFVIVVGFGALLPVLPLYMVQHGVDLPTLGAIVAAWGIAKLISEPIMGWIADRGRRRQLMLVGLVLLAITSVLPLFFTTAAALFVLRFATGFAAGMYGPAARGLLVDATAEDERGEAFGLYASFGMGGLILGPVIGGLAAALGGGFASAFVITAVLTLAAAGYLAYALRHIGPIRAAAPDTPAAAGDGTASATGAPTPHRRQAPLRGLANRPLLAAVTMNVGFYFSVGVYEVVWSLYLERLGASIAFIGLTFTLFGVPVMLLSPIAGRLVDRHGGLWFAAVAGLVIAASGFLYTLAVEPIFPAGVVVIEATAVAFMAPALYALAARGSPEGRTSTAQGVLGASGTMGVIVASLAAGVLWARDPDLPFYLFVVVAIVSVAAGLAIARVGVAPTRLSRSGVGAEA
jgi:MFS transporter, DHA1 family, multidrug resistance protein